MSDFLDFIDDEESDHDNEEKVVLKEELPPELLLASRPSACGVSTLHIFEHTWMHSYAVLQSLLEMSY
jgi:hypothetical protein